MLREIENHPSVLKVEHALGYLDTQRVARALDQQDMVEYWKSAPYLLNFMEDYQFKRALKRQVDQGCERELVDAIVASPRAMLSWKEWTRYERIDPVNAQLQAMIDQTLDKGWWRLLWVPPSLPYYQLEGPFADVEAGSVTKRLVFSNWHVVPRAVSALLSYEADRRMVCSFEPGAMNTTEARESRRPLLVFTRTQDRLSGMPVLAMLYPGTVLADIGDPLSILDREGNQRPRTLDDTLALIKADVCQRIAPLIAGAATSGPEDPRWYWAMPILLDARERKSLTRSWFDDVDSLADAWAANEDEGGRNVWREHVREARRVAYGELVPEGRPPKDLADVLALLALAGPGVTALRALARVVGDATMRRRKHVRYGAGRIAWGFRSLFNVPEVISLLRGIDKTEPYWRRVLEYCAHGCLQSTLDEYMHVQREGMGLFDKPPDEAAAKLADAAAAAVGMHVATPGVDEVHVSSDGRTVSIRNHGIRGRFAMRFGQERIDDGEKHFRADQVRQAFNSPFWPFVLVTTSVGQEGLDFHQYCHAVVHWNLPSNPVDLEQREGRVHRYKGHAVRKNIARRHAEKLAAKNDSTDPWHRLFKLACGETGRVSDINPFWVYPIEGGAAIERHVPALPLSRESARLPALRRSLAVYRMVFGQPRQDDLVDYLMHHIEPKRLTQMGEELRIDLTPPGGCDRTSLSSG
jgi:hypothetical protein